MTPTYLSISSLYSGAIVATYHLLAYSFPPQHLQKLYYTGWPKSNVPKVRAYCSVSDHLIRKIFSGVCRDIHWFEEYLKIIEIDDIFSNERSFYAILTPMKCLDHIPFRLLLFGSSRYVSTVKIRALASPVSEI